MEECCIALCICILLHGVIVYGAAKEIVNAIDRIK